MQKFLNADVQINKSSKNGTAKTENNKTYKWRRIDEGREGKGGRTIHDERT